MRDSVWAFVTSTALCHDAVSSAGQILRALCFTHPHPRHETASRKCVHIRSPVGKSVILAAASHPSFQGSPVYYASMAGVLDKGFKRHWQDVTGVEWVELTASPRSTSDMDDDAADGTGHTLVLIDEGQLLWDSDKSQSGSFWTTLKNVLQGGGHICIVMAAAYGSEVQGLVDGTPTPTDLQGLKSVNPW